MSFLHIKNKTEPKYTETLTTNIYEDVFETKLNPERKKIENSIHLEERSEKDAQFGRPQAHAKEYSDCEAEGIDAVKDEVDTSIKEARDYLSPVTNKIDEIKFKMVNPLDILSKDT